MTEVVWLFRAEADSQRIYNRLEDFQEGRGEVFLRRIDEALQKIRAFPESAAVLRPPYRRQLLRLLPYALVYSIEGGRLIVVTIAPLRQDPGKLMAILDNPEE